MKFRRIKLALKFVFLCWIVLLNMCLNKPTLKKPFPEVLQISENDTYVFQLTNYFEGNSLYFDIIEKNSGLDLNQMLTSVQDLEIDLNSDNNYLDWIHSKENGHYILTNNNMLLKFSLYSDQSLKTLKKLDLSSSLSIKSINIFSNFLDITCTNIFKSQNSRSNILVLCHRGIILRNN